MAPGHEMKAPLDDGEFTPIFRTGYWQAKGPIEI